MAALAVVPNKCMPSGRPATVAMMLSFLFCEKRYFHGRTSRKPSHFSFLNCLRSSLDSKVCIYWALNLVVSDSTSAASCFLRTSIRPQHHHYTSVVFFSLYTANILLNYMTLYIACLCLTAGYSSSGLWSLKLWDLHLSPFENDAVGCAFSTCGPPM